VVSYSLLQGIFLTQESNPGLLHSRKILYCLSHQGSPFIHMKPLHSSPDKYLGYLCISALVGTAGINMRVKISLQYSIFISFGYIPELGLLDCIVVLFLIF